MCANNRTKCDSTLIESYSQSQTSRKPTKCIQLPELASVVKSAREVLLLEKLQLCSKTYNFLQDTSLKQKQNKFSTLKEIESYISDEGRVSSLSEQSYQHIVKMVSCNIFREFPPREKKVYLQEFDEATEDPAWPHLKVVYDIFLKLINSAEINISLFRRTINRFFISKLVDLFDSEDSRERRSLKNALLSLYLKFFEQREFIRKEIRSVFLWYIYEGEDFNGIAELLDIMSKAINGYNVPLRKEHEDFFLKVLIPLHEPKNLIAYQKCLIECLKGFIRRDGTLAADAIRGILKFWPKTNTEKEILFLEEIAELAEIIPDDQFEKFQVPLMKQISKSISSLHFQVSESALSLWEKESFTTLVNHNMMVTLPILYPGLIHALKDHWNYGICDLASDVLRTFYDQDPVLFNQLVVASKFKALTK